jgi:tetratricopeptide (TPR) repeat protein
VARRRPDLLAAWTEAGDLLRALGRYEEASRLSETGLRGVRGRGARAFLRASLAAGQGRPAAAAEALGEVAAECPQSPLAPAALGGIWLAADRPTEALDAFETALHRDPWEPAALTWSHQPLLQAGRPRTASLRSARACEIDPDNWLALAHQLELRCRTGKASGAPGKETRHLLRRLLRIAPDRVEAHRAQAWYHMARGERVRAAEALRAFLARHPRNATGWLYQGLVLDGLGELPAAVETLAHALALEPGRREIRTELCRVLARAGNTAAAVVQGEQMLRRFPESWSAVAGAARAALQAGRWSLAVELSQGSTALQPRLPAAWLSHGELLSSAGALPEAAAALSVAHGLLPAGEGSSGPARVALLLARCHARNADLETARSWFHAALEEAARLLADDAPAALAARGGALAGLGDPQGALAAYRAALDAGLCGEARGEALEAMAELDRAAAATGADGRKGDGEKSRADAGHRPIARQRKVIATPESGEDE